LRDPASRVERHRRPCSTGGHPADALRLTGVKARGPRRGVAAAAGRSARVSRSSTARRGNLTPSRGAGTAAGGHGRPLASRRSFRARNVRGQLRPASGSSDHAMAGPKDRLARELARWQKRQSEQRLTVLSRSAPTRLPRRRSWRRSLRDRGADARERASFAHAAAGGQIVLEWEGQAPSSRSSTRWAPARRAYAGHSLSKPGAWCSVRSPTGSGTTSPATARSGSGW